MGTRMRWERCKQTMWRGLGASPLPSHSFILALPWFLLCIPPSVISGTLFPFLSENTGRTIESQILY